MEDNNMQIVLEVLGAEIKKLRLENQCFKYENERLRKENAKLKGESDNG